ncbi:DUF1890 domain-containing protein [Methanoplanus sp. FWC-SCC4]|uniref:DUF1890 domain-containing protein n=1 Tax=Methanochimaera problematica TaxID=2609417 RepID=A0AA97I3P2_9EURY|nr:DUF1890 domain-containing protein [Methanoplanus sp. FWC-SCC4]WOF15734.1 DUF1890 domain-containing protein [Methanoplanus sp. FWC-SCC4]
MGKLDNIESAVLVMGCPQVPVQTTAVLYIAYKLKQKGISVNIAGTPAARMLIKYADPESHYFDAIKDLDKTIGDIVEKREKYPLCFVFIHNDAGVSYATTMDSVMDSDVYPVIFGSNAEELSDEIKFECEKIVAVAAHNPKPLINSIDGVMKWDA